MPRRRIPRWQAGLAACVGGMVAITWTRCAVAGTLRVDDVELSTPWTVLLVASWILLAGAAFAFYWKALEEARREPLRDLLPPAIALHSLAALSLPFSSNDLFSYLAYGRMVNVGLSPYAGGPDGLPVADSFRALVGAAWISAPSAYGPVLNALCTLAARTGSVVLAVMAFKLMMLAAMIGTLLVAQAACQRRFRGGDASAAFAFLAFNPLLLHEISGQGHNEGAVLVLVATFVWAALAGRELLAAGAATLALCAKVTAAPVLGLYLVYLLHSAPRRALRIAALAAGLVGVIALGPWAPKGIFQGIVPTRTLNPLLVSRSYSYVISRLAGLAGFEARLVAYRAVAVAAVLLVSAFAARAVWRSRTLDSMLQESLAFLLVYFVAGATWVQPWYLAPMIALALVAPGRWRRLVGAWTAQYVVAWFPGVGWLQAVAVNTAVLVIVARWSAEARDEPSGVPAGVA